MGKDYEQPGKLYLGRERDVQGPSLLLPAKQLSTHAAIIGMTGSGKTGLGIALLEELALAKVPALVIDPKGDMANLLLSFPELAAQDFAPWIDADQAARSGKSVDDQAAATAEQWREGLAQWDQDGERIKRLQESADFAVFTPGSAAGRPISVLGDMEAPPADALADKDTLTGLVNATVSSLLSLVGINADPMKSREHVLLATILLHFWQQGESVGLAALIAAVAKPPFSQVGVFPVDSFYPENRRMELAMQLNTIVASPSFQGWLAGEALNLDALLQGSKPRINIFSIAHLADAERMFFVTLLLGRVVAWMRRQQGSDALRAVLYMDEIFGYFPPNGNPPAKAPMLLLLKQARAFGLSVVLATQNPVDLDYKGMANIGTWFVGRLQTRQDQERVLSGMGGEGKGELRDLLAGLKKRCFLLHSAHRDQDTVFHTRWTLSYLKGPIALAELGKLAQPQSGTAAGGGAGAARQEATTAAGGFSTEGPLLPGGLTQYFVPSPLAAENQNYRARLLGMARLRHVDQRRGIDQCSDIVLAVPLPRSGQSIAWEEAEPFSIRLEQLADTAPDTARFAPLPADLLAPKALAAEKKRLADHLYRSGGLKLFRHKALGLESAPGEDEAAFRVRLAQGLSAQKNVATAELAQRYTKKRQQLELKLHKAEAKVDKEQGDLRASGLDTVLSVGSAVLGAFFGRKGSAISKSTQGMRSAGRLLKERQDVQLAKEELALLNEELVRLAAEEQEQMQALAAEFDPACAELETVLVTPKKSDIFDVQITLLWEPELEFASVKPLATA